MTRRAAAFALIAASLAGLTGATAAVASAATAVPAAPPELSAPSAILVEPATGDVVYARRATQRRPIASTTKLMTALLLLEHRKLSDMITAVPYHALPAESVAGLRAGERLTAADMLRALLLASANDAAAAIAVDVSGSQKAFVRLMNQRARSAGLRQTHYANPIGLDSPSNYSTATDLAKLALLVRRSAFAREVMDSPSAVLRSGSHERLLTNRNTLIGAYPWMNGVKTGHTNTAGYILVGSASRGGVPLLSVVLDTPSEGARNADTLALMRYGFANYHRETALRAGETVATLPVADQGHRARVVAQHSVRVVARRGEQLRHVVKGLPDKLTGPVAAGTRVGEAEVLRRGHIVARVPLVTAAAIAEATFWQRNTWIGPTAGFLAAIAILAGLAASLRTRSRRRAQRRRGARSEAA